MRSMRYLTCKHEDWSSPSILLSFIPCWEKREKERNSFPFLRRCMRLVNKNIFFQVVDFLRQLHNIHKEVGRSVGRLNTVKEDVVGIFSKRAESTIYDNCIIHRPTRIKSPPKTCRDLTFWVKFAYLQSNLIFTLDSRRIAQM